MARKGRSTKSAVVSKVVKANSQHQCRYAFRSLLSTTLGAWVVTQYCGTTKPPWTNQTQLSKIHQNLPKQLKKSNGIFLPFLFAVALATHISYELVR